MGNIIIQRTRKLDQPLFDVIIGIWQDTGITNPARADDLDSIRYNLNNGGMLLLAWDDEQLVGTIWLSHDFRRLYIHHMAVATQRQSQGIGRTLLQEAVKISKELGYQAKLEVHRDNPAARHLYASLGFTDLDGYITMIRRG